MPINHLNGRIIGNRDMIGLNANHLAVFLVRVVDGQIPTSLTGLVEEPEIRECSYTWSGDVSQSPSLEVGGEVVEEEENEEDVWDDHVGVFI